MSEIDELRARVEELERKVGVLFEQTGTTDWAHEGKQAPEVSDEVQVLLAAGESRKAAKLYMEQTGANIGQAAAALGELSKELRGA